jgi:glycosyltransferase involved in cell wall biosynthesis
VANGKKLKILYLITGDDVGGAQKYIGDLSENLEPEKFETKIVAGGRKGVRFLSNAFRPYLLFINDWLALIEIFRLLRREKPDLLHLNSSKAGVIGALAAFLYNLTNKLLNLKTYKLKTIFTAHGWVFNPDNDLGFGRRKFYVWLHKIAAKFQDVIINVSDYDRKLALKYKIAPAEKLITIHNGLNHKNLKFLDKKTARKVLLKMIPGSRSPIPDSAVWIGSIGRLAPEKSYADLIKAAAHIKNPDIKFFIIGGGPEKKKLESLILSCQLQNNFFILENIAPAAHYLPAFDIFALSSIKEGLPYTLLEAMAAELPIVTTRVGGMTEIIDPPDGIKKGLAMPPQEPEELARAINYLLKNPGEADKLSAEAKKFLKEKMTLERMTEETEKIYSN